MARGPTDLTTLDPDALRGELLRARARIEEQRVLLGEAHRHALATSRFTSALSRLSQSTTLERDGMTAALVELVRAASECLEVARVGVWLADPGFERLECVVLVHQGVVSRRPGTIIDRSLYPAYFDFVSDARVLPAHDVTTHPATQELLQGYLGPLGITSLLDAPVRVFGRVVGIVCHEHLGPPRRWSDAEEAFAAHLGDFVALAIEAVRREDARRAELEAQARYRHLVDSLPVTIYRLEPERGLAFVSPRILELTGRPASDWHGVEGVRGWLDRVHPEDRDRVRERLRGTALLDDQGIEYRITSLDAAQPVRWVHDVCRAVRSADGGVVAIEGVITDVTERANANAKVHEWERRFQTLFRNGDLTMVMLDLEGRVSFASEAFLALVGKPESEVLEMRLTSLADARDRESVEACLREVMGEATDGTVSCEFEFPATDRTLELGALTLGIGRRTIRFHLTPLREGSPNAGEHPNQPPRVVGVIGVGMDVTPLVAQATQQHDKEKEASLSRLAAGVAHDLNNVLAAVRLTASVLSHTQDPSVRQEALTNLSECAQQASELTQRLMDIARSRPTSPQNLEVDTTLRAMTPLLQAMLTGSEQTLELRLDAPKAWIRIGEVELRQILLNLVSNARDASGPRSPIILRSAVVMLPDPSLLGHALTGGPFVVIEVEDRGHGVAPELRGRIFDPYFSTKQAGGPHQITGRDGGHRTGLGLSSSRGLARQVGGDLRCESGSEGGARLVLLLPLKSAPPGYEDQPSQSM